MQNPQFEYLLLRRLYRDEKIVARMYSDGCWHQFSGQDVCAHFFQGTEYWNEILGQNHKKKNIIFITSNSYHSFIASISCVLCGYNVIWLPSHLSLQQIQDVFEKYDCFAIATDIKDYSLLWTEMTFPVIGIDKVAWMDGQTALEEKYKSFKNFLKSEIGAFLFFSCSNKNEFSLQKIHMDVFLNVAKTFVKHIGVPKNIPWHSFEIMAPSHPFVHLSKFCCFLKEGILGFPNYGSDLETSLSVLQPTFMFASSPELEHLSNIFKLYSTQPSGQIQRTVKKGLSSIQKFLSTNKAMKLPENMFVALKRMARVTSKFTSTCQPFVANGLDNLEFIVHGFTSASPKDVHFFESYGIPVIETYGTLHAVGMLSSNTYRRPYLNTIGAPLSHVYLRLGSHSTLAYKFTIEGYENGDHWHETGDIIQMTPFGFMLTGRKKHVFLTAGEHIEQEAIQHSHKKHEVLHWSGSSIQTQHRHKLRTLDYSCDQ